MFGVREVRLEKPAQMDLWEDQDRRVRLVLLVTLDFRAPGDQMAQEDAEEVEARLVSMENADHQVNLVWQAAMASLATLACEE